MGGSECRREVQSKVGGREGGRVGGRVRGRVNGGRKGGRKRGRKRKQEERTHGIGKKVTSVLSNSCVVARTARVSMPAGLSGRG